MSQVGIKHNEVITASSNLKKEAKKMETLNSDLETLQTKMKGFWESSESEAFHLGYNKFQSSLAELSTVIKSIANWADTTQANYENNDNKGAQFYGSIFK
ncbi:WXG100 family type VII secretion target [Anaerosacchariphilus polymeriproducens]|uniref:ESAT-6-like protein n=1 Tax=Anaerosacchariphilus polymeriproducens TaxID=1812858 RepID=A0A371B085_9FIRM|nr:WXG100 family type VII secretion target [Anaerosacchariphilus polymeriproducens]RDU25140.1 hypothetical protein DWV06_01175 [Anaerosacchariphilus polymeriproducens]